MQLKTHILEKRIGEKNTILLVQITFIMGFGLLSTMMSYLGYAFYLILMAASGVFAVIASDYFNRAVNSENRVTLISIKNMLVNLVSFVAFPVFGSMAKNYSLQLSLVLFATVITGYILLTGLSRKRILKQSG